MHSKLQTPKNKSISKKPISKKPTPQDELASTPDLYRAKLNFKIGRDVLSGEVKPPCGLTQIEYSLYNLLHGLEDLASYLSKTHKE
jgi:hypothetical protein